MTSTSNPVEIKHMYIILKHCAIIPFETSNYDRSLFEDVLYTFSTSIYPSRKKPSSNNHLIMYIKLCLLKQKNFEWTKLFLLTLLHDLIDCFVFFSLALMTLWWLHFTQTLSANFFDFPWAISTTTMTQLFF